MSLRMGFFGLFCLLHLNVLTAGGRIITLEQAKQAALENNLAVVQASNAIESAQSRVTAAYGDYLPTLSASGGWNRYQNDRPGTDPFVFGGVLIPSTSGFSVDDDYRAGLSLNYTLFNGFAREANFSQASSSAIAAEHQSARARQTVVFQVESGYLNLLRLQQLVKVTEGNLTRDRRQLERITEANRVGSLSLADVYRQRSQVAVDEFALINAQNDYDKAQADLVALIGMNVSEEIEFSDPSLTETIAGAEVEVVNGERPDFSSVSRRALEYRPDYHGAKELVHSTESGETIARSNYFPIVTAGAGYGISGAKFSGISDNKTLNWGLNVRWNIFDGFTTNQLLESASAGRRNAEIAFSQAERNINVEVKKALLDLEAARKQYQVSQEGLISATEDRRIQEERYNLGAGTLLDLLTANAALVNAEANKVNATFAYIITKSNLDYVIGEKTY